MKLGFTNGQQFKAKIRTLAKERHLDPQLLMQEVVLDEIVDRISRSAYRDNLILKGGFLVASMLGVDTRSTRDIDTAVKGIPVSRKSISKVFTEIAGMNNLNDDIHIQVTKIEDIRESDVYAGFRVHLRAKIYASEVNTKIDVSTGDTITPREVTWHHHTIFNNQNIMMMAYNIETILAEKLETIVTRGDLNTRLKDYYDLYLFDKLQIQNINFNILHAAVLATAKRRGTDELIPDYAATIEALRNDLTLNQLWVRYQERNEYAKSIEFAATCNAALDLVHRSGL